MRTRVLASFVTNALLLVWTPTLLANPVPENLVFTHVQGHSGEFCVGLPIAACDEIVHTTSLLGILDFDLVLHCPPGLLCECSDVECHVRWSSEWCFVAGEACGGAGASVAVDGNEAVITIPGLDGLPMTEELLGMARVTLDVPARGHFEIVSISGCPYAEWIGARAGVECSNCCMRTCGHLYPETPSITPHALELQAEEGEQSAGTVFVTNVGLEGSGGFEISSTVAWLLLEVENTENPDWLEYEVTLTADATSLAPGAYTGWVLATCERCFECARIDLTVLEKEHPAAEETTWGVLKGTFGRPHP